MPNLAVKKTCILAVLHAYCFLYDLHEYWIDGMKKVTEG